MASSGTEIMLRPDEGSMTVQVGHEMPTIGNMNVTNSRQIHVGPKFVSVNQTVENKELIKGHILGLELVSPASSRRLRCSVAVFLCWAFLVSSGLAFYLFYIALHNPQTRLDIGLNETWYLRQPEWQSVQINYDKEFLKLPLEYAIIGHTAGPFCEDRYACIKNVLDIQEDHRRRSWDDIGPNFVVGGNGDVFEGRGANIVGIMTKSYNRRSISIMFIGDYRYNKTNSAQIDHLNILLDKLVEVKVLEPNFTLYGYCQVKPLTISPGPNVMSSLKNLRNWKNKNEGECLKGLS